MASGAFTAAGTKIYVTSSLPVTHDSSGFGALTFTEVLDVIDFAAFGRTYEQVNHAPLGDRATYRFKGGYEDGMPVMNMAISSADAVVDPGQAIVLGAIDSDDDLSFKIEYNDNPLGTSNSIRYFRAKIFSTAENVGTRTAVGTVAVSVGINGNVVKVAAVA